MPTVLVTGANRGIGLEFARQYADDGWRVHAGVRDPGKAGELKAVGGELVVHRLDVADERQIAKLADKLGDEAIDVLLNNAGVGGFDGQFGQLNPEAWLEVFRINSVGPALMAQHFAPHLERGRRKLIVSITSQMGSIADNGSGGYYSYRSSKAALNMVSKSLSVDLRPRGITAVVFHPGWVQTDMGGSGAPLPAEDSVSAMRAAIGRLRLADTGKFFDRHGRELPW